MAEKTIFSFLIDSHSKYAYSGFHLARSLVQHCGGDPGAVHIHMLPEVPARTRRLFAGAGYRVHEMQRFGDRRHCNKAAQLESLCELDFDQAAEISKS